MIHNKIHPGYQFMEGSIFSYRLILPIGLLFASAIYILYTGIIMMYFEHGSSYPTMLIVDNSREALQKLSITSVIKKTNYTKIILNHKLEKVNGKSSIYVFPQWFKASLTKMESVDTYKTEELKAESTCGETATRRGPNQRVVSFAFYGNISNHRGYFKGIEENAKLMNKYYPNWIMRVYHDIEPIDNSQSISSFKNNSKDKESRTSMPKYSASNGNSQEILSYLVDTHSNLDLCYAGYIPGFGNLLGSQANMWRFLPMADPLVDVFVSRDLDSHPSEREFAAVNEWIKSNFTFHIMRDHPYHSTEILAGMWGAALHEKRKLLFDLTIALMIKGIKSKSKGLDQQLLREILWPATKGSLMQHDSYFCVHFGKDRKVNAWPTRRNIDTPYNFVGSRIGVDSLPLTQICPLECRPQNKKHWIHC